MEMDVSECTDEPLFASSLNIVEAAEVAVPLEGPRPAPSAAPHTALPAAARPAGGIWKRMGFSKIDKDKLNGLIKESKTKFHRPLRQPSVRPCPLVPSCASKSDLIGKSNKPKNFFVHLWAKMAW